MNVCIYTWWYVRNYVRMLCVRVGIIPFPESPWKLGDGMKPDILWSYFFCEVDPIPPHGKSWKMMRKAGGIWWMFNNFYRYWLVVWNSFYFSIIPTDFHSIIFQRGRSSTNQYIITSYDRPILRVAGIFPQQINRWYFTIEIWRMFPGWSRLIPVTGRIWHFRVEQWHELGSEVRVRDFPRWIAIFPNWITVQY